MWYSFLNFEKKNEFPYTVFEFKHKLVDREPETVDEYRRYALEIIEKCLNKHNSHRIVEGFKDLINHEVEEAKGMGEKIKYYFKMTRVRKEQINAESIRKF